MPSYKNLQTIFNELEDFALKNNLSIDDFAENTGADPNLIRVLFDDTTDVVGSISRIFEFAKIKLHSTQHKFLRYKISDSGTQIRITRVIEPKCSIVYDKATAKYYQFKYKKAIKERSKTMSNIIKSEIKELIDVYLEKNK